MEAQCREIQGPSHCQLHNAERLLRPSQKEKQQNKTTVTNNQAGISKELSKELGPGNTILYKKSDFPAAIVVKGGLWPCEK